METYGDDNEALADYIQSLPRQRMSVDVTEVFRNGRKNVNVTPKKTYTALDPLRNHICKKAPRDQIIRILSVAELSGPLLRLLGSKYEMDHELWTCRFQSSDREWFAGPLIDRGARKFSHFNLSCVDFKRATAGTPEKFKSNRKLGHTVRLMRLRDLAPGKYPNGDTEPRVFVIRRISGHIRCDRNLWTFIYFSDPYINDLEGGHLITDIPGNVQQPLTTWINEFVSESSSRELIDDLSEDGFGFVLRILREIKTTWKLLLNEMEVFLEDLGDVLSDEQLMESATWLHRRFILNIDYFQRQLLYHQRYVTYLVNAPSQEGLCIAPSVFEKDLLQEKDALLVVDQRLKAIRNRTSAILETVVNLNAVKQGQLAAEMTKLQHQDAALTFSQGQSIRRLTILNMVYLPATFIATVYGMNIVENDNARAWSLWSFIVLSFCLTVFTLVFAAFKIEILPFPFRSGTSTPDKQVESQHAMGTSNGKLKEFYLWVKSLRIRRIKVERHLV